MGADRKGGDRRTPARAMAYAACGVVLLAGCASMPDNGDLRGVESTPRQDTQVRVFAMPPRDDAPPSEIVQGFLEALTSDDPRYSTARQYLTPRAAQKWEPERSTTVLADGPGTEAGRSGGREEGDDFSFTLTGAKVATVDAQQSYTPAAGGYSQTVHLTRDKKSSQWRIDALPQGVVMGKSDFQRNYMSVNKYYFASNTTAAGSGQPMAVADPVYVRERVDPTTQMVRSLLSGPTSWLRPVVRSSFPTGTTLRKDVTALTPDDQNKLTVPLNDKAARIGRGKCDEMAAQLLYTLQSLTPTVDEIALRADGRQLCSLTEEEAVGVASRGSVTRPAYLYFIDGRHRLVRMASSAGGTAKADAVPGALGDGAKALRSVAVARDEHSAAGVSLDGKTLYVTSTVTSSSLGEPVLQSSGKTETDRLTTPSWDAQGDLWVADRNPAAPRLLLLEKGGGQPLEVLTPRLDGRINAVRVAADGARIALVVDKDGKQSLLIGRIERTAGSGDQQSVSVQELRSATPELEQVSAVSWAGDSRLVVVGRESGGVEQVQYVQCDGSIPEAGTLPGLTEVKSIAASEDSDAPLFATSKDGLLWLPGGSGWRTLKETASAAFYPG
ncbi:LpqB family beta-propeller domain-containing protein [Streptomyces sp. NBC_01275]|uniref:LpqB family beta-propeller domain-containing protein n=1 Tax=Streptomyces sp. NBC_01275 TaxID=2903807 RepID=UPI00224D91E9|nr:LpqB family beta-propeller domain-containing protein [Streptomyces sp. NBC_01275]MCX4762570.1 LpqB family beta-propeller domain-containing protein [Streptomyces sp. NBC_01275]